MFGKKTEGSLQKLSLDQLRSQRCIDSFYIERIEEESMDELNGFHDHRGQNKKNAFKLPIAFGLVS